MGIHSFVCRLGQVFGESFAVGLHNERSAQIRVANLEEDLREARERLESSQKQAGQYLKDVQEANAKLREIRAYLGKSGRTLVVDGLADNYDGATLRRSEIDDTYSARVFEAPPPEERVRRFAEIKVPRYMLDELKALGLSPSSHVRVTIEVLEEPPEAA